MKNIPLLFGVLLVLVAAPAMASDHTAAHRVAGLVAAWNSHDVTAMASQFSADATAVDILGRTATGRSEIARLLASGQSKLRLTSAPSIKEVRSGIVNVEFEAEVTGLGGRDGLPSGPVVRRFVAVLVWGPDLPGGHHPSGRFFIASIDAGSSAP